MRRIFKAIFSGLIDAISERYRVRKGRKQGTSKVRCPSCGGRIDCVWDTNKPEGWKWIEDKCPHCYWRYGNGH